MCKTDVYLTTCMQSAVKNRIQQDRQCQYKCNLAACSCNDCCREKGISVTYSECVYLELGTQHAIRMHLVILSSVACPSLQYFSTLSHKQYDIRKSYLLTYLLHGAESFLRS